MDRETWDEESATLIKGKKYTLIEREDTLKDTSADGVVKYVGPASANVQQGDYFVVVGFVLEELEGTSIPSPILSEPTNLGLTEACLGKVSEQDLEVNGPVAVEKISNNLAVTLDVAEKYWKYFKRVTIKER